MITPLILNFSFSTDQSYVRQSAFQQWKSMRISKFVISKNKKLQ